ncbi:hypothetical protein Aduo_012807 [Ancylostoma duodenale]
MQLSSRGSFSLPAPVVHATAASSVSGYSLAPDFASTLCSVDFDTGSSSLEAKDRPCSSIGGRAHVPRRP